MAYSAQRMLWAMDAGWPLLPLRKQRGAGERYLCSRGLHQHFPQGFRIAYSTDDRTHLVLNRSAGQQWPQAIRRSEGAVTMAGIVNAIVEPSRDTDQAMPS